MHVDLVGGTDQRRRTTGASRRSKPALGSRCASRSGSVLVAFAADVDHRAVGGTAQVADVANDEFLGP